MKKCPRCDLNYIEDYENMCDICYVAVEQFKKPKYDKRIMAQNEVRDTEIIHGVTANEIFQSLRYLTYDYGEYSIFDTDNLTSYRNILNKLKSRFRYAKTKYNSKAGFAYIFESDEIWKEIFLADADFNATITHRQIESIGELIGRAYRWHSLPWKRRNV